MKDQGGEQRGKDENWRLGQEIAGRVVGVGKRGARMDKDLYKLLVRYAFGSVWSRPEIDVDTRRLLTLSMLIASGHYAEFRLHVRYAIEGGVSRDLLKEVMLHSVVYCGFPAALSAFRHAEEVFAEIDRNAAAAGA